MRQEQALLTPLPTATARPRLGGLHQLVRLIQRHPIGALGAIIVLIVLLMAIFAPWVAPYDPAEQAAKRLLPPSATHYMGTDELGRDVFSRVVFAARTSLYVGVLSVSLAIALGVTAGVQVTGARTDNSTFEIG